MPPSLIITSPTKLLALGLLLSVLTAPAHAMDPLDALRNVLGSRAGGNAPSSASGSADVARAIRSITEASVERVPDNVSPSSAPEGRVVLYRTAWCGYCKQAAAYMNQRGVSFIERDIERDTGARRDYNQYRVSGVPLIVMGSQTLRGFNAQRFDQMYAQYEGQGQEPTAGRPRRAADASTDEPVSPGAVHTSRASFYPGDTLVAKIDGVPIQAQPVPRAGAALTRLAAGQAVIFIGEQRTGFSRVVAAGGEEGWVQTVLLGKP